MKNVGKSWKDFFGIPQLILMILNSRGMMHFHALVVFAHVCAQPNGSFLIVKQGTTTKEEKIQGSIALQRVLT